VWDYMRLGDERAIFNVFLRALTSAEVSGAGMCRASARVIHAELQQRIHVKGARFSLQATSW
jgi:hypothetical protein